jgi:hypothetical protein
MVPITRAGSVSLGSTANAPSACALLLLSHALPPYAILPCLLLPPADCYMVAGGLMRRDETGATEVCLSRDPLHAQRVVAFAKVRAGRMGDRVCDT